MKKRRMLITTILIIFIFTILVSNSLSYGLNNPKTTKEEFHKTEIYELIVNDKINYKDQKVLDVITNWYNYFEIEDMFLTEDGEFIDYTTYEIYRVHLENQYKKNTTKIAKHLLKSYNYPKEENNMKYEEYINEYIKTTGKEI